MNACPRVRTSIAHHSLDVPTHDLRRLRGCCGAHKHLCWCLWALLVVVGALGGAFPQGALNGLPQLVVGLLDCSPPNPVWLRCTWTASHADTGYAPRHTRRVACTGRGASYATTSCDVRTKRQEPS